MVPCSNPAQCGLTIVPVNSSSNVFAFFIISKVGIIIHHTRYESIYLSYHMPWLMTACPHKEWMNSWHITHTDSWMLYTSNYNRERTCVVTDRSRWQVIHIRIQLLGLTVMTISKIDIHQTALFQERGDISFPLAAARWTKPLYSQRLIPLS